MDLWKYKVVVATTIKSYRKTNVLDISKFSFKLFVYGISIIVQFF